jgi:NitT/TauT family transport system ATP-binding protein
MPIIFNNISKKFSQDTEREIAALAGINFTIEENEFVSIIGPSGCGKTTLLKIIAGLIKPDKGNVIYRDSRQPNAILVFQDQGLLPWLNVMDNIGLGLELKGIPKAARREQVLDFMKRIRLDGFESHFPHELSGGMRQRVALARAFLTNADILLMDEPFGSLDAQTRIILQEELLNLLRTEPKTVLFVTHDIDEAILLSDQIVVISDRPGKVQQTIRVDIVRPRDRTTKDNPIFKEIQNQIWQLLEQEVRKELKLA